MRSLSLARQAVGPEWAHPLCKLRCTPPEKDAGRDKETILGERLVASRDDHPRSALRSPFLQGDGIGTGRRQLPLRRYPPPAPLLTYTPPAVPHGHSNSLRTLIQQGRIVFGCARLHHLHRPHQRERLLRTALDGGITRFDAAPSYGNGLAERALGKALRRSGIAARVNTKAGLPSRTYPAIADLAFPLFRLIDMMTGSHRRAYRRRDFRPEELRQSLQRSMERIGVGAIDTLFLHEPLEPFSAAAWRDITQTMIGLVAEGKTQSWGIAGPAARYGAEGIANSTVFAVQQPMDELTAAAPAPFVRERLVYGTYGVYRAAAMATSFETFLRDAADRHVDTSFLVSTLDEARLRAWVS